MKHTTRWIALGVAVLLVAFSVVLATQVGNDPRKDANMSHLAGKVAPEFTVETLDGERLSSRDLEGKSVIVNFWNSWCRPCLEELRGSGTRAGSVERRRRRACPAAASSDRGRSR